RAIFWFINQDTFRAAERSDLRDGIGIADSPASGRGQPSLSKRGRAVCACRRGRSRAARYLRLLGSVTRLPRPRWRVPGRTASGQGATALIGIATISTSLSGPGAL